MRRLALMCALVFGLGWALAAHGQDCAATGPTQLLMTVTNDGVAQCAIQASKPVFYQVAENYSVNVPITVQKSRTNADGQVELFTATEYRPETKTRTVTVVKMVYEIVQREIDLNELKAFETTGKTITAADLKKRCAKPTLVVCSCNDMMIPDYHAAAFKPGTVIVALPKVAPVPFNQPQPLPPAEAVPAPAPPAPGPQTSSLTVQPVAYQATLDAPLPTTPQPQFIFVSRDGNDGVKLRAFNESEYLAKLTVFTGEGDKQVTKEMEVKRTVRNSETTPIPLSAVKVSTPGGGDLTADRVRDRLTSEVVALLGAGGKAVDPFWLQNIKPTVLVLRGVSLMGNVNSAAPAPMPAQPALPRPVEGNAPPPPAT